MKRYPPSLHRLHIISKPPGKATIASIKLKHGGFNMQVQIKEIQPFSVIGYASRHRIPGVKNMAHLPNFYNVAKKDYDAELSALYKIYTRFQHCEVILCLDIDEDDDCFTYMIGVGVDKTDYGVLQRPGTYRHEIPGGLYAVFTTPLANNDTQLTVLQDTWKYILEDWLPGSEYEYDETRPDYEYHDERAHDDWRDDGKCCTEIRIPIVNRK